MKNWFDVITPHEDIRKGHFDEAVFAADLGDVAGDTARPDYNDPFLFFKKTYLTQGLNNLLGRVYSKLTAGEGASVIEIQTPFGGGKTHALVAIYHYLKHGEQVNGLLPAGLSPSPAQGEGRGEGGLSPRLSVVAGNHWNPVEGRTDGDLTRHTFWGEVAYQVGGKAGYEAFRRNDEARISPGKNKLLEFLAAHQPFILLFDEILEYINRALDERVRAAMDVSLGTQTFSFFQELTETVSVLPRGMMVVTLPSSYLEDFGDQQQESLDRLNKIFGRVESIETPVQGEEVYAVIRRRLFEEETLHQVQMREIVHHYFQLYQQHRDDLPPKARDVDYRRKMELAYPFHPDVVDILYEKWSTFPLFQRTRGVLRLLANVVEDLYQRELNLDLILPGDLNLERPAVRQEFLKHIGSEYEGIIGSDIAGHEAKAQALDAANRAWKHLAQRVATAIFFHSFSADDSQRGISLPYIKLATLRSDTIPALVTEVLGKLSHELWYLNSRADAHYFSRIPNLNRMIRDKKELFSETYEDELEKIVEREIGPKFRPYLWPETGDGIPDNRALKLVILHPNDDGSRIPEWVERKGGSFREYKNTLFFALAETAAFTRLREDVKTYLALKEIKAEIDSGQHPLLEGKRDEVQRRMHALQRDFSFNVRRMYHTLRFGGREVDLGQPGAGAETLSNWYWRELTSSDVGAIVAQLHYRTLVNKLLAGNEMVATAVILDQFYKNPELPAPAEEEVVARAIQLGVKERALGLAEVREGEVVSDTLRYAAEIPLGLISFEAGETLISQAKCEALLEERAATEEAEAEEEAGPDVGTAARGTGVTPTPGTPDATPTPGVAPTEQRFQRVRLVVSGVPASKIADVNRGILMPISAAVGDFKFTLEIDVTGAEGITQATLENKIKETIRQIGARVVEERVG
jgi:hypothetical protein